MKKLSKFIPVRGWTHDGKPIVPTPFMIAKNLLGFKLYRGLGRFYFKQMFLSKGKRNGTLPRFVWFSHLRANIKCLLLLPIIYYYRKQTGRGMIAKFVDGDYDGLA